MHKNKNVHTNMFCCQTTHLAKICAVSNGQWVCQYEIFIYLKKDNSIRFNKQKGLIMAKLCNFYYLVNYITTDTELYSCHLVPMQLLVRAECVCCP